MGHHSGGLIWDHFCPFSGQPGDFQLFSFPCQLTLPQSLQMGGRLSQGALWTEGPASCRHTKPLPVQPQATPSCGLGDAWQYLLEKEVSDRRGA